MCLLEDCLVNLFVPVPVSVCVCLCVCLLDELCVSVCSVFVVEQQSTSREEEMRPFTEILNKLLQGIKPLAPTNPRRLRQ